jgi:hypothetical protein
MECLTTSEINLGAVVCNNLKIIFHQNEAWPECWKEVAKKFTELKIIMKNILPEKNSFEIVQELSKYSVEDLKDVLDV